MSKFSLCNSLSYRCAHCHSYLSEVFSPAATLLGSEDITMATLDIEAAKEVQTKSVTESLGEREKGGRRREWNPCKRMPFY